MIGRLYGGGGESNISGRPFAEGTGDNLSSCETLTAGGPSDRGSGDDIWLCEDWLHTAGEPCDGGSGGNFLLCGTINGLGGFVAESSKTSKAVNLSLLS